VCVHYEYHLRGLSGFPSMPPSLIVFLSYLLTICQIFYLILFFSQFTLSRFICLSLRLFHVVSPAVLYYDTFPFSLDFHVCLTPCCVHLRLRICGSCNTDITIQ
jgi:hypothetical protein